MMRRCGRGCPGCARRLPHWTRVFKLGRAGRWYWACETCGRVQWHPTWQEAFQAAWCHATGS